MSMTMAEKILARASGRSRVRPDEVVVASVDLAMSHENADLVRKSFIEIGARQVRDPARIVIIFDHRVPAESEKTATTHKAIRGFVSEQGIAHFYDVGRGGICHQVLAEQGHVLPGMVVVGTDSHTTTRGAFGTFATGIGATEMAGVWTEGSLWFKVPHTIRISVRGELHPWISAKDLILWIIGRLGADGAGYRAVEFAGETIEGMTIASRMVLANLSMEMGAKVAFTPVDERLLNYLESRTGKRVPAMEPDHDAVYERVTEVDARGDIAEPQIACPHGVVGVDFPRVPDSFYREPAMARIPRDAAVFIRSVTRRASIRIVESAFEYALRNGRSKVTAVHKANVLRATCGTFLEAAEEVAGRGMGFADSGNIGASYAVFEPAHGSAPKYAGQNKVNPLAALLAAKMMLEWLGESEKAMLIEHAVAGVISNAGSEPTTWVGPPRRAKWLVRSWRRSVEPVRSPSGKHGSEQKHFRHFADKRREVVIVRRFVKAAVRVPLIRVEVIMRVDGSSEDDDRDVDVVRVALDLR